MYIPCLVCGHSLRLEHVEESMGLDGGRKNTTVDGGSDTIGVTETTRGFRTNSIQLRGLKYRVCKRYFLMKEISGEGPNLQYYETAYVKLRTEDDLPTYWTGSSRPLNDMTVHLELVILYPPSSLNVFIYKGGVGIKKRTPDMTSHQGGTSGRPLYDS